MSLHFEKQALDILNIVSAGACLCGSHDIIALFNLSLGFDASASDIVGFVLTDGKFNLSEFLFP